MKIWAFRDLATNTVRITSTTDPSTILEGLGLKKQVISVTGGFGLRPFKDNLQPIVQTLEGQTGRGASSSWRSASSQSRSSRY